MAAAKTSASSTISAPHSNQPGKPTMNRLKKKTNHTIFFRYTPTAHNTNITRQDFETFFSDIGPIKKCSLIRSTRKELESTTSPGSGRQLRETKGYGFCKFTCQEDAESAVKTLNETNMELGYGQRVKVWVDLASESGAAASSSSKKDDRMKGSSYGKDKSNATSDVTTNHVPDTLPDDLLQLQSKKRTSRVILRNLSFYATEYHIKQSMEEHFGPVAEITLPLVPMPETNNEDGSSGKQKRGKKKTQQHRGFAFVTFNNPSSAQKAVDYEKEITIKKRPVAIDFSVPKAQHQRMASENQSDDVVTEETGDTDKAIEEGDDEVSSKDSDNDSDSDSETDSSSDSDSKSMDVEEDVEVEDVDDNDDGESDDNEEAEVENTVSSSLFIRNLPFDVTRHELFNLFSQFGYINGIYLVKDSDTGINRGTAFINFRKEGGLVRALEAAATSSGTHSNAFTTNAQGNPIPDSGELVLRGRTIFINRAVDKETASSLKVERDEDGKSIKGNSGKDKRNLYLKNEGRVLSEQDRQSFGGASRGASDKDSWENLPISDQQKRGRAHQDKSTKIRSPLFFFNPFRLSIRNLSKDVDEVELKSLIVRGIQGGLDRGLVSKDDIIAHLRASGEMTNRQIVQKVKEEGDDIIPTFDAKSVKQYVPSVFIDRDFQSFVKGGKKVVPPSRGFGFADFKHHAHALACLRELNNNTSYSADYCAGGKKALEMKKHGAKKSKRSKKTKSDDGDLTEDDGVVKIPRLIVDFTVENKSKAQKQAERREVQRVNAEKQKLAVKEKKEEDAQSSASQKNKKKGRGAVQREKKRKRKEQSADIDTSRVEGKSDDNGNEGKIEESMNSVQAQNDITNQSKQKKKKSIKPTKKQKVDKEEVAFEDMVRSYKQAIVDTGSQSATKISQQKIAKEKRWFD